ncbi:vacuolar protein-sorting-associated protein 25 [Planococcus citri]|uniref:vacuolar protein-sorting-associated protein 25 n=1 Tax=Planococcus citri TaxID=170843 RepID=UPI0031F9396A
MADIQWPWQYNFPPFFTIQPNAETRKKQLEAWRSLILSYFKQTNQHLLDLSNISNLSLFNNSSISRSLNREDALVILEYLAKTENAEPIDKNRNRWYILWHSKQEWADIIMNWVQKNGYNNAVVTFHELQTMPNQEFTDLHEDILIMGLKQLERQNKAEIISMGDTAGVKFFD